MKKTLFIIPMILFLVGCANGGIVIDDNYTYTNPDETQHDFGPEIEDGVTMDGKGEESFYDNEHIYRIDADGEFEEAYAEVKFGFGVKGFLAHAFVHESEIYENVNLPIHQQDSFELYINPGLYRDQLRSNCLQFRTSPTGRQEAWIGMHSPVDDYPWTRSYAPFRSASFIDGELITQESQMDDEDYLNSNGIGYEFYIPYTTLGLDYNPEGLDILPAMVTTHSLEEDDRVWSPYNGIQIGDIADYPTIGNRKLKDQGNNIFDTDRSSSGFILDHQLDETKPYVSNFGYGDQYGYFNTFGTSYYAKVRITLYHELESDPTPKVGMGSINSAGTSLLLLDPRPAKDNYQAILVNRVGQGEWGWPGEISWAGPKDNYNTPVTFEVVRSNNDIHYFMNGVKIFASDASTLNNEASYPTLMTMNYSAKFDECIVSTDESLIAEKMAIPVRTEYLNYDLSTGGYTNEGDYYSQSGGDDQFGVFNHLSTHYTMSVDIQIGDRLNGDNFPKIGIGEYSESKIRGYLMDPRPAKDTYITEIIIGDNVPGDKGWNWGTNTVWEGEQNYNRKINLKVVRNGATSSFYMDNILAWSGDNGLGSEASHPCFFTMNHTGTFSNISLSVG